MTDGKSESFDPSPMDARCEALIAEIRATVPPFRTWGDVTRLMRRMFREGWTGATEAKEEVNV